MTAEMRRLIASINSEINRIEAALDERPYERALREIWNAEGAGAADLRRIAGHALGIIP